MRWWWVWRPSTSTGQLIRNIGSTLVTRVAVMFIALLSSVLLARLLGPAGRGVFALLLLIPSPATSLGLLGFEQANAVYAGLEPRGRRTLIWQSAAVAAGVGTVLTATAVAYFLSGAPGFEALAAAPPALVLLLATIPARLVVEHWGAILRGMNRIQILNLFEIGGKLAPFLGVVVLVWALDLGGVRRGGRREHVGNLLLVPRIGIVGAAIASSVSYSILSAILIVCYLRVTGLSWVALVPRTRDLAVYVALWRQILDTRPGNTHEVVSSQRRKISGVLLSSGDSPSARQGNSR